MGEGFYVEMHQLAWEFEDMGRGLVANGPHKSASLSEILEFQAAASFVGLFGETMGLGEEIDMYVDVARIADEKVQEEFYDEFLQLGEKGLSSFPEDHPMVISFGRGDYLPNATELNSYIADRRALVKSEVWYQWTNQRYIKQSMNEISQRNE
jgi:hypothetical protein